MEELSHQAVIYHKWSVFLSSQFTEDWVYALGTLFCVYWYAYLSCYADLGKCETVNNGALFNGQQSNQMLPYLWCLSPKWNLH